MPRYSTEELRSYKDKRHSKEQEGATSGTAVNEERLNVADSSEQETDNCVGETDGTLFGRRFCEERDERKSSLIG